LVLAFGVSDELVFAMIFDVEDIRRRATSPVEGLHVCPGFPG